MKQIFILLIVLLSFSTISAQSEQRKNAVHLDLGGWSFWYSLNYERRISLAENHRLTAGAGFMLIPIRDPNILIGVSANYLLGKTHNLELGVTPSYLITDKEFLLSPRIGYRYEAPKGFLFRIGTAPSLLVKDGTGLSMLSWGYLSFGYAF